jgi:hypothetical protein
MEITEKDLEDLIFESLLKAPGSLSVRGLTPTLVCLKGNNRVHWQRQVELRGYGRADIIGWCRCRGNIHVNIMELKNVPIVSHDFNQIGRYREAVAEIVRNSFKGHQYPFIDCYLIGPSIQDGHYIQNVFPGKVYTFDYSIRGVRFKQSGTWRNGDGDLHINHINRQKALSVIYGLTEDAEYSDVGDQREDG